LNEERLRLAHRAARIGTWDWNPATGALHGSPEMYALLGLDPNGAGVEDLHATWLGLIHQDDRRQIEVALRTASTGEGPFEADYRFFPEGPGGTMRWMTSRGRVVQSDGVPEDGRGTTMRMVGVAVDVTERRQAEFAAQESLALLQSSLDALSAQIAMFDESGKIVAVNAAWQRMAKSRAGVTAGVGVDYFAIRDTVVGTMSEAGSIGAGMRAVARRELKEFRREYTCPDPASGCARWFQLRVTRFGEGTGVRLVAAHEDITEVRRSTEALKALTGRLLTLQDEERRRIARELHDTTVQDLAMAIIGIDTVSAVSGMEMYASSLAETWELIERSVRDVRTLSYLLHPPLLDECGLAVALAAYAEGFSRRSSLACELDLDKATPDMIPSAFGVALFRVAQEAFTNVHRHSGARQMRVCLRIRTGEKAELCVEDDGHGFRMHSSASDGGMTDELHSFGVGISGMHARLRQLGGTLRIKTGVEGTRIVATVPIPPEGRPLEQIAADVRPVEWLEQPPAAVNRM
jgi:two-component system, NarL family, sensor kinase